MNIKFYITFDVPTASYILPKRKEVRIKYKYKSGEGNR